MICTRAAAGLEEEGRREGSERRPLSPPLPLVSIVDNVLLESDETQEKEVGWVDGWVVDSFNPS